MLNLGLMKIRLVSASGLLIFCFQQTHLSSPSLPTGRQAQEGVFRCEFNNLTGGTREEREGIVWEIEILRRTSENRGTVPSSGSAGGSGERMGKIIYF
jgi:hypothetical protein